ncbi:ankyrin repeat domain-containing protein [Pseudoxanthomonas winnipegensis]|uniref:ankyrin repeat domain-containing protein n=1 Tax=Pseudoxanthomonas winnipegensis TaxID=2480810 RepID=UPI00103A56B4|nr:ankyrin repeat domain-containing protein [Pseudoxanthomonas winnipegensis]TBV69752.1 hypothetical protein EYC45_19070 [Pseudoxanthomonas winnipegensis]
MDAIQISDPLFPLDAEMQANIELERAGRHGDLDGVELHLDLAIHAYVSASYLRAAENGHTPIVKLLNDRMDVPTRRTALLAAAVEGRPDIARAVLATKPVSVTAGPQGQVAFNVAVDQGRACMMDVLAPWADHASLGNALCRSVGRNDLDLVNALIPHCAPDIIGSALLWAAHDGLVDMVDTLMPHAEDDALVRATEPARRHLHLDIVNMLRDGQTRRMLQAALDLPQARRPARRM